MYPEHLLHAVNCGDPDQSKRAITSLTKFVNLASRGQLPEFIAPIICIATLTALKNLKDGVRPIAVGEVIRRLIAKCIAREANSEAADLFNRKQSNTKLVQHNWYLDVDILAGTHQQLCTALNLLTNLGEGCGLELRIEKCELWSPVDLNDIDKRVKRNSTKALEILGAAIGNPSFVAASLRKRTNKIEKLLVFRLAYLDDPHCALGILRSCLGAPKMVYSLRCNTPSDESSVILQDFDNLQRTTFENMLSTVIGDSAWKQTFLPINKTGVGIRQAVDQLKAAFVGPVSQADALVEQITGEKITGNQIFKETVEELKNLEISEDTQHKIQEARDDAAFSDLLGNQISNREKACLLSLTLPQSGAWLSAAPIPSLGLHLQPNEFRAALKYRIGVPLYIEERKCPYCQNGRLDKLGDHALSCNGRGYMISRHNRVRDRIFAACRKLITRLRTEKFDYR